MHHRPDCALLARQVDEFSPRDRCDRASAPGCVHRDPAYPLHRWVHMVTIVFGVDRSVIFPCVVIAIFTVTGLRAAPVPSFLLLSGGFILCYVLFVTIVFFRHIHHVDVI